MIKLFITGANGFIGKSIHELLDKSKYDIIIKSHKELDLLNIDQVKDFFDENKNIDFVIHCATAGGRRNGPDNPRIFYENTKMFENLILFKDCYKQLITFGSGAELESQFPLNYYGLSKKYITEKIKQQNLNAVVLRIWGCFGKHETSDRFIKANLMRYKNKHPMIIHQNKNMDFYYVNDIIPVINHIFNNERIPKEINLKYRGLYELYDVAEIINNLEDHKVKIITENIEQGNDYAWTTPTLKHIKLIGLHDGIKQMWDEF